MEKIGQIICTYRKLNGISQEELAGIVGVSAGAVSKWERDISLSDLDVLCNLVDYFRITVDELLGRKKRKITDIQFENEREANRYYVALELIECCKTARNFGLLAVEEQLKGKEESIYSFLRFAVYFLLDGFYKQITPMDCKPYLVRYAEAEKDSRTANMICEVIVLIFSGENEEIVKDVISSFLGRKYAGLILKKAQLTRDEQIEKIALMDIGVEDTGVLDSLLNTDDYHIQMMLRQMENDEFLQALAGTSKEIRIRLLQNLSDRLIGVIAETLQNVQRNVDDISEAQRKIHTNDGINGVANYLNNHGYTKKLRQNGTIPGFSASFVKAVLDNPVYAGKIAYGRRRTEKINGTRNEMHVVEQTEYPVYKGKHEAIISEEDWNLAQEKRKLNSFKREKIHDPNHAHILSGIIKCPCCGKGMYGNIAKEHKKDNKTRYYYYCKNTVNATGHKCTFRLNIEQSQINDVLARIISGMTKEGKLKEAIQAKIGSVADTSDMEKELSVNLANLNQAETIKTRDTFYVYMKKCRIKNRNPINTKF